MSCGVRIFSKPSGISDADAPVSERTSWRRFTGTMLVQSLAQNGEINLALDLLEDLNCEVVALWVSCFKELVVVEIGLGVFPVSSPLSMALGWQDLSREMHLRHRGEESRNTH